MTNGLEARVLSESDYDKWTELIVRSPEGSIYSDPQYLKIFCSTTGGNFRIIAVEMDGQLLGGIALYIETTGGLTTVTPRILLYYNGFVVSPDLAGKPANRTSTLLQIHSALYRYLDKQPFDRIFIKTRPPQIDFRVFLSEGWLAVPSYSYVVPLDNLDLLWSRMDRNLKRLVRRCEKSGLTLTNDDDFASFWRLHKQTHERKGTSLYLPEATFKRYIRELQAASLCQLYHARFDSGEVVATQLVLTNAHRTCHTVTAAADAEFLNLGASAYLRWMSFKNLASRGFAASDLTDASLNSVTRFKRQLGGELTFAMEIQRADSAALIRRLRLANIKARLGAGLRRIAGR